MSVALGMMNWDLSMAVPLMMACDPRTPGIPWLPAGWLVSESFVLLVPARLDHH